MHTSSRSHHRLMPLFALLVALVLLTACGSSRRAASPSALSGDGVSFEILDYGILEAQTKKEEKAAADTKTGKRTIYKEITVSQTTTRIPAEKDMKFGFIYRIRAPYEKVQFEKRTIHPPANGERAVDRYALTRSRNAEQTTGYDMGSSPEKGPWSIQLWYNGVLKAQKDFEVY